MIIFQLYFLSLLFQIQFISLFLQNNLNFCAKILDFSKVTDYYFTWFDLQRKKYNSLFASHKHSFALSCISVKRSMSNATPKHVWNSLCHNSYITSSISSLLLRKEASISRPNKKFFFTVDEKRKNDAHYSKTLIFVKIFQFWRNLTFRHIWIFAPKLENILEYFIQ